MNDVIYRKLYASNHIRVMYRGMYIISYLDMYKIPLSAVSNILEKMNSSLNCEDKLDKG